MFEENCLLPIHSPSERLANADPPGAEFEDWSPNSREKLRSLRASRHDGAATAKPRDCIMTDESEADLNFEQALGQLEQIVTSLERGEPELTSALAKYEIGTRLLRTCYGILEQAEQSVALLTGVDAAGRPLSTPFDATATVIARDVGSAITLNRQPEPNTSRKRKSPPATSPLRPTMPSPTPEAPAEGIDTPF